MFAALLAMAGAGGALRASAEAGRDALLTRQRGSVEICREGSSTWTPVIASRYLGSGDAGQTLAGARAQVRLQFGNVVLALGPSTRFAVAELNREFGRARVDLGWGSLRARLEGLEPDRFQVVTPNATLAAQGTEWTTHHVTQAADGAAPRGAEALPEGWPETPPGHTRAAIHRGRVRVVATATGASQLLEPRMTVDIGPDGTLVVNPPDFPYRDGAPTGSEIEKGTTGQGEPSGEEPGSTEGPTQPSPHPTGPRETGPSSPGSEVKLPPSSP